MKISFSSLALLLVVSFCMSSCLKDKDYDNGLIQSIHDNGKTNQNLIELQLTAKSSTNFLFTAFDAIDHDTTINLIPVALASKQPASEDIHVTLVPKAELVDDYNNANNTGYVVPSTTMYTVVNANNIVTIPKGSRIGYLQVKLRTSDFLGQEWAFGYTIGSVDKQGYVISGNLNTGIMAFGIKNKYDGHYLMTGTMVDSANLGLTGQFPIEVNLETVGGNSVVLNPVQGPFAGGYLYPILSGGAPSAYGSFTPVFVFDATDNVIEVDNYYGQPASNTRSAQIDPSGTNKYFPDRHIDVKFWMNQPSVRPGHRSFFDVHFAYLGPR